jgi:hypothetical protein
MQSPAGHLCILLVLIAIIVSPIMERRLLIEKEKRMKIISGRGGNSVRSRKVFWELFKIGLVFIAFRVVYRRRLRKRKDK